VDSPLHRPTGPARELPVCVCLIAGYVLILDLETVKICVTGAANFE